MCLVSGALALGVSGDCEVVSWLPSCFPESRPWVLSLSCCNTSQSHVMSSVGRLSRGGR